MDRELVVKLEKFVKKLLVWLRVFYWELRVEGDNQLYLMMCAVQATKPPGCLGKMWQNQNVWLWNYQLSSSKFVAFIVPIKNTIHIYVINKLLVGVVVYSIVKIKRDNWYFFEKYLFGIILEYVL